VVAIALALTILVLGLAGALLASHQLLAIRVIRHEYDDRVARSDIGARLLEYGALGEDELAFAPRVPSVAAYPSFEQYALLPVELRHAYRERLRTRREWRRFGTVGWTTAATVTAGLVAVPALNSVRQAVEAASSGSSTSPGNAIRTVLWIVAVALVLGVPSIVAVRARMLDRRDHALERSYDGAERRLAGPDEPLAGA
jgi:hypothetical protein